MTRREIITVQDAATRKGVTAAAVYVAIKSKRLKAVERFGRVLVFADEIEEWRPVRGRGRRTDLKNKLPV